jgi:transglutaminase-like putative cysteine protease
MPNDANDLLPFLLPTEFIDSDTPAIRQLAEDLRQSDDTQTAIALFEWVRDQIRYDPWTAGDPAAMYKASAILERRSGYCVQKAVVLAALGRAAGIPSRLGFADVRNHKIPDSMREIMGTNLFVFHGYVEFHLEQRWLKATPAFDRESTRRAGALLVELDGSNDALLHPVDPEGHPYIEYVRDRGTYADVPLQELRQAFLETYANVSERMDQ